MSTSSTYPQLPFPTHSWRLSHHTGAVDEVLLYKLLLAASLHLTSRDCASDITSYLVVNKVLPPNVRKDSGQADIWRDYQQVLSEAGLMFSTRSGKTIRFTPAGLSYLDRSSSAKDILTIQAFRWQYPNGHNTQKSRGDKSKLNFTEQQIAGNVRVRPAVMVWQVLSALEEAGRSASLTAGELESFLFPARTHNEIGAVVGAISQHRSNRKRLTSIESKHRNALDWITRLSRTHAFHLNQDKSLSLSRHSTDNARELSEVMDQLLADGQWWVPPQKSAMAESWYQWYGTQDTALYPVPDTGSSHDDLESDELNEQQGAKHIALQEYQHKDGPSPSAEATVTSTYAADISESAHRLHDTMVRLIAERCIANGGRVFFDPRTVDLLIQFSDLELLLEVKSATPINFNHKLRSALGQVIQYDFLRSKQSDVSRRLALAVTLDVPETHWSREFVADYLNMDLVALRSGSLHVYSKNSDVLALLSAR